MYHAVKTVRGISPAGSRAKGHSIPSPRPVINKEIEVQDSQTTLPCQGVHWKIYEKDHLEKIPPSVPSFKRQT